MHVSATYLEDVARFRADDPAALVNAALACPICLRGDAIEWEQELDVYDESVDCHCPHCGEQWRVYLQPQQMLRLELLRSAGG